MLPPPKSHPKLTRVPFQVYFTPRAPSTLIPRQIRVWQISTEAYFTQNPTKASVNLLTTQKSSISNPTQIQYWNLNWWILKSIKDSKIIQFCYNCTVPSNNLLYYCYSTIIFQFKLPWFYDSYPSRHVSITSTLLMYAFNMYWIIFCCL